MICPRCECLTRVCDGRRHDPGKYRRRRECLHCGFRFSTVEVVADTEPESGKLVVGCGDDCQSKRALQRIRRLALELAREAS